MARSEAASAGIASFWEALFRHKAKLVIAPILFLSLAALIIMFAPRTYRSEAKLFLQVGRESVGVDPTATSGPVMNLMKSDRQSEVKSAIEILKGRQLIGQVVDEMGADYILRGGPPGVSKPSTLGRMVMTPLKAVLGAFKSIDPISEREEAIIMVEEHLSVKAERDSTVLVMTYDTKSAIGAQRLLKTLSSAYQREHMRINRNQGSRAFLEAQRDGYERQLEEANAAVLEAKNRMGIASIEGRRSTLESQLQAIELDVYQTEQGLATATASIDQLRRQLSILPERQIASRKQLPNEGADLLRDRLYELQMEEMNLKARYRDDHPLVQAISMQVEQATKVVGEQGETREETTNDINPVHRQLSLDLKQQTNQAAGLQARLNTLKDQQSLVMQNLKQLNNFTIELEQLKRQAMLAEKDFFTYSGRLQEARIDEALEEERISSISMVQDPTFAEKPVSPSKGLVAAGGLLLSFAAAGAWILGSEQMNDRVRSEIEVERSLGLPVMTTIPEDSTNGRLLNV